MDKEYKKETECEIFSKKILPFLGLQSEEPAIVRCSLSLFNHSIKASFVEVEVIARGKNTIATSDSTFVSTIPSQVFAYGRKMRTINGERYGRGIQNDEEPIEIYEEGWGYSSLQGYAIFLTEDYTSRNGTFISADTSVEHLKNLLHMDAIGIVLVVPLESIRKHPTLTLVKTEKYPVNWSLAGSGRIRSATVRIPVSELLGARAVFFR